MEYESFFRININFKEDMIFRVSDKDINQVFIFVFIFNGESDTSG